MFQIMVGNYSVTVVCLSCAGDGGPGKKIEDDEQASLKRLWTQTSVS